MKIRPMGAELHADRWTDISQIDRQTIEYSLFAVLGMRLIRHCGCLGVKGNVNRHVQKKPDTAA